MNYPKLYKEQQKQFAFENACDCLYFGMGRDDCNWCGLGIVDQIFIWDRAFNYMAERA